MAHHIISILKKHWGYDAFRPMQQDIIEAVLQQKDVLALMPTGGGKSLCYQVPAMAMEGICLVISPLIALMKDQVASLIKRDIPALKIHAGMSYPEVKRTLENAVNGPYKFLYVSPERLQTDLFKEYLPGLGVNLVAIDEAHCISQWGYDFRPQYLKIATLREELPQVPFLALTASATPQVQEDIAEKLLLKPGYKKFQQGFERPNLSYSVFNHADKENKLLHIVKQVKGSGIVYCKSRRRTVEVAQLLMLHGHNATHYHAGLSHEEREKKQQAWLEGSITIMVCTNAFGMGIDKPNVRLVVHADAPDSPEHYYQEAGRAGRDGKRAYAVLLCAEGELESQQMLLEKKYPSPDVLKHIYFSLMNYLQIPAGAGIGESLPFDLALFCKNFSLNLLEVSNALKIFEQQNLLSFSESVFRPAELQVVANREQMEWVSSVNKIAGEVLKGLLRSYSGILDAPVFIHETALAKFTGIQIEKVIAMLHYLHQQAIVHYVPYRDMPEIYLAQNRMYADAFHLDYGLLRKLKQSAEDRLRAMEGYINAEQCRAYYLSNYFGAPTATCGICDNCIEQKNAALMAASREDLAKKILLFMNGRSMDLDMVLSNFYMIPSERLKSAIDLLETYKCVSVNISKIEYKKGW